MAFPPPPTSLPVISLASMGAVGNGTTDDTAAIQAALTLARTLGGAVVEGSPGARYLISSTLVISSNTTLDVRGCTVSLKDGVQASLITNYASVNSRTVVLSDGATTASSTTLTSATAAFTTAEVGLPLRVYCAGPNGLEGNWLDTTIQARTSGTQVTMGAAASSTTTIGGICIGTRDTNITILGGTWYRPLNTGTPPGNTTLNSLLFRRVDGLSITGVVGTTLNGKYFISLGDTTDFQVDDVTVAVASDAVHLNGLCLDGRISRVDGSGGDDMVGVTCNDYAAGYTSIADVNGVIGRIHIADINMTKVTAGTPKAVILYGDPSGAYPTFDITIERAAETGTTSQRSVGLNDTLRNITVSDCPGQVLIAGASASNVMSGIVLNRVHIDTATLATIVSASTITITDLLVDGATFTGTTSMDIVFLGASVTATTVTVRNAVHRTVTGRIVNINGASTTVSNLALVACYRDGVDYSVGSAVVCSGSATLTRLEVSASTFQRCQRAINVDQSAASVIFISSSRVEGSNYVRSATGAMTVFSSATQFGGTAATATGGTVTFKSLTVGNAVAATVAVGALANKIEVFDLAGTSLGFIPVYATIT